MALRELSNEGSFFWVDNVSVYFFFFSFLESGGASGALGGTVKEADF